MKAVIDERALDKAISRYDLLWPNNPIPHHRVKAIIEAYEAARWRPIEEAPPHMVFALIGWPQGGVYLGEFSYSIGYWVLVRPNCQSHEGDSNKLYISPGRLIELQSMFRTIDPPSSST
ncbi:MAG: hypothetical protein ACR2RF_11485 [Geminicoccaceae bacterium]